MTHRPPSQVISQGAAAPDRMGQGVGANGDKSVLCALPTPVRPIPRVAITHYHYVDKYCYIRVTINSTGMLSCLSLVFGCQMSSMTSSAARRSARTSRVPRSRVLPSLTISLGLNARDFLPKSHELLEREAVTK